MPLLILTFWVCVVDLDELLAVLQSRGTRVITNNISWIIHYEPSYKSVFEYVISPSPNEFAETSHRMTRSDKPRGATATNDVDLQIITIKGLDMSVIVEEMKNAMLLNRIPYNNIRHNRNTSVVVVSVSLDVVKYITRVLQQLEHVVWIEIQPQFGVKNYRASAIVQSDVMNSPSTEMSHAIWNHGITGEGEIVGLLDTGIDHDHCMFHDTSHSISVNQLMPNHRKIIYYQTLKTTKGETDDRDFVNGHGTHVAATIAGNVDAIHEDEGIDPKLVSYNGVAKDAKLFFTDSSSDSTPFLRPDALSQLFQTAYDNGARIHSNSWGCDIPSFMECAYPCNCYWTVLSDYGEIGQLIPSSTCLKLFGVEKCCELCSKYNIDAQQTDQFTFENDDFLVVAAAGNDGLISPTTTVTSPSTSKNAISVGVSFTDTEGLISSVDYFDISSQLSLVRRHAITDIESCCHFVGSSASETTQVRRTCCPSTMKEQFQQDVKSYHVSNIVPWSSRGPTLDGRNKPDMVAPGFYVSSAHSDGNTTSKQCDNIRPAGNNRAALMSLSGSSMAVPVVSGSAALVRQYYRQVKQIPNPSGYLIKATLIHSCQAMKGTVSIDGSVSKGLPSGMNIYNGYGLLSLPTVLQFNDSDFSLFAFDRQRVLHKQSKSFCFQVTKRATVRATLSWYDPPGPLSLGHVLVNNLDLTLRSSSLLRIYRGNDHPIGDDLNNNERVDMERVPSGSYVSVHVHGRRIMTGAQSFALTVTGHVKQTSNSNCAFASLSNRTKQSSVILWLVILGALTHLVVFL